jgi:DNA-binding GntR family transcriptional regulator
VAVGRIETATKAEAAYVALRDAIRAGRLAPGQRLTLQDLADDLGMSLTPVREALRMLATQGMVEQRAHVGTVVAQFTRDRAEEIYRLRLVLEPLAARMAAEAATQADLDAFRSLMTRLRRALDESALSAVPELNAALHRRIYQAAGSTYLLDFIDRLWNGVPFQAISLTSRMHESHTEHEAIMDALARRDGTEAERVMREHISEGRTAAIASLGDRDQGHVTAD